MSDNGAIFIRDQKIADIGLLGGFGEELLQLEFIPAHSHSGACAGFKRTDQGRSFFKHQVCHVLILAVYVLYGHNGENRKQDDHRADKYPRRDPGPEPVVSHFAFHKYMLRNRYTQIEREQALKNHLF